MNHALARATDVLTNFAIQLTALAEKHAPQAWQILLGVKRIEGLENLVIGAFFLIMAVIVGLYLKPIYAKFGEDGGWFALSIFASIAAIGSLVVSLIQLLDIWNYVAVFNPGLALAHDLFVKLTGAQ